jgi:hypothetical protein
LLLYSSYLPHGVPNWTVIYINRTAISSGERQHDEDAKAGGEQQHREDDEEGREPH